MPKPFHELRERLLLAGIAPRHVSRYLSELADHLADLKAEEESRGLSPNAAESSALLRLGTVDDLASAMINQPQLQSWSSRAPWAVFGLAPILILAIAWSIALSLLWSGWNIFLPSEASPFVGIHGLAVLYFGVARLIFFTAPLLIGWAIVFLALRQRIAALWPMAALALLAIISGTAVVHARAIPGGLRHVSLASSVQGGPFGLFHILLLLTLMVLPYLLWRLRRTSPTSA